MVERAILLATLRLEIDVSPAVFSTGICPLASPPYRRQLELGIAGE